MKLVTIAYQFLVNNSVSRLLFATRKRTIITIILVSLIVFWRLNDAQKPDWELDAISITEQTLEENISASGKIAATRSANLTFLASENIKEIVANNGEYLEKGDIIAKLDSTSLYQSYLQAESTLRSAEANVDSVYDSLQNKKETETFAEINTRTTAEVTKDKAYRSFVIARKNLANTTLRAPFNGIVNYNDGTSIGKFSSTLSSTFTIIDPNTIYFSAEINEIDISKISIGTTARLELDAYPEAEFEEKVTSVGYVANITSTGGTAYKVRISLPDNIDSKFRIGMNGDVEFILSKQENILSVPQSALVEENENSYVWAVDKNQKSTKVYVETGVSSIDDIEIISGIENGSIIITRPPSKIEEGDKIKINDH